MPRPLLTMTTAALMLTASGCVDDVRFDHPCDPPNVTADTPETQCLPLMPDAEVRPRCPDSGVREDEVCAAAGEDFVFTGDERLARLSYAFAISTHEVTRAEWARLMGPPPDTVGDCRGDACPVTGVTWFDATAYCDALSRDAGLEACYGATDELIAAPDECLGYRLPTEAEFTWLARGALEACDPLEDCAAFGEIGGALRLVESYAPTPPGLFDLFGNVEEWLHDTAHEVYGTEDRCLDDPHGGVRGSADGDGERFVAGGHVRSPRAAMLPTAREAVDADTTSPLRGFRVARTLEQFPVEPCE